MNEKHYRHPKARDHVVKLATYWQPPRTSLYYIIVVGHPDISEEEIAAIGMKFEIFRYSYISIAILFGFMRVIPLPSMSAGGFITSAPRKNKMPDGIDFQIPPSSLGHDNIDLFMSVVRSSLFFMTLAKLKEMCFSDTPLLEYSLVKDFENSRDVYMFTDTDSV